MTEPAPEDGGPAHPAPDLSLLPDHPARFFGLSPGFDRKDLKRSYHRCIRLFKPEFHPEEFKKIRAAFERLDAQLRYLGDQREPQAPPAEPPRAHGAGDAIELRESRAVPTENTDAEPTALPPIEARVDLDSLVPQQQYWYLRDKLVRTALDYVRLALLADVVETAPEESFSSWLFAGLREHGGVPELFQPLSCYCRADSALRREDPEALIRRLAATIPPRFFGFCSERLWIQVLERDPARFAGLFAALVENLLGSELGIRAVLTLRLLRSALFRAGNAWVDAQVRFLAEHHEQLPSWATSELELIDLILEYRQRRAALLRADQPLRAASDELVVAISGVDDERTDRVLLGWKTRVVESGRDLLHVFPYGEAGTFSYVLPIDLYQEEARQRLELPVPEGMELLGSRVAGFIEQLEHVTPKARACKHWNHWIALVTIIQPLLWIGLALGCGVLLDDFLPGLAVPAYLVLLLSAFVFHRKLMRPRLLDRVNRRSSSICYREVWRAEVLRFLRATRLPLPAIVHTLRNLRSPHDTYRYWVAAYAEQDAALHLLSIALR